MSYQVKNVSYSPVRIFVNGSQVIIPGRQDTIENSITVEILTEDILNLQKRGILKVRILK
jgi:hypothetical protein